MEVLREGLGQFTFKPVVVNVLRRGKDFQHHAIQSRHNLQFHSNHCLCLGYLNLANLPGHLPTMAEKSCHVWKEKVSYCEVGISAYILKTCI